MQYSLKELINPTERQLTFLNTADKYKFVLYGGAKGGGKSYILRWALIRQLLKWAQKGLKSVRVGLFCEDYPALKDRQITNLDITYNNENDELAIVSCENQIGKLNKYFKEGDEICKVLGMGKMKAVISVPESEVRFLKAGLPIKFKLNSKPYVTYVGKLDKIRKVSTSDPKNPKLKNYLAEILVDNPGDLRPVRP